jgi:hypothetical protein
MKQHHIPARFFFLIGFLFLTMAVQAQKENNVEQVKELPKTNQHITKELEAQITEIVRPVKEQLEKILNEDASGTYAMYKDDIRKISELKNSQDKRLQLEKFQKKYYPFIKKIWDQLKIDEGQYRQKLINIFSPQVKETIRFGEFLNFTMSTTSPKPAPPPPPPPSPSNICVDANTLFSGSFGQDGGAIGGSRVQVAPARPPSPAEIVAAATTAIVGTFRCRGWIRNTITIPANFPSNYKVLRSKKTFDWRGNVDAVAFLGVSWGTVAYSTSPDDNDFTVCSEIYTAVAPVIFVSVLNKTASRTEEAIFTKNDTRNIQFGITCYASATSSVYLSFSNATSSCAMTKWDVCEE